MKGIRDTIRERLVARDWTAGKLAQALKAQQKKVSRGALYAFLQDENPSGINSDSLEAILEVLELEVLPKEVADARRAEQASDASLQNHFKSVINLCSNEVLHVIKTKLLRGDWKTDVEVRPVPPVPRPTNKA